MNKKCKKIPSHFIAATGLTLLMSLGGASAAWETFKQSGDALFAFEPQKYTGTVAEVTNNSCMSGGVYENIPDEVFNSIDDLNTHYDSSWTWSNNIINGLFGTPVTVEAATLPQFKDEIPDWSVDVVKEMSDAGVLKGYDDGTFKANKTMTRMEFLKTVVCSVKSEAEIDAMIAKLKADGDYEDHIASINKVFKDAGQSKTADSFWGTRYIIAAREMRISELPMLGVDNSGNIFWEQGVSREEAAAVMYAACTNVKGENLQETIGIQNIISDYNTITMDRAKPVKILVSEGLLAGVDSNYTIAPKKTLTRAEASAIVARINNKSRRLAKPVVPVDKRVESKGIVERDETYHNPVTGKDETKDINEWAKMQEPSYSGTKAGEFSKDGYWKWDAEWGMWIAQFPRA